MIALARGLVILCLVLFAHPALAAKLRLEVGARKVGVGQAFEVKVTAVQKDGDPTPTNPQIRIQGKVSRSEAQISSRRSVTMRNFSFNSETSTVATWVVKPEAQGKLVVGPATFLSGGKTLRSDTVIVEVVDEPQPMRRRSPFGGGGLLGPDPSDIFGDDPFDRLRHRFPSPTIPDAPPEYQVDRAPDPTSFLRLVVDKKNVVLGQPVRLTVLAYGSRGNFREVSPNEPSLPDFLSYSVIETSHDEPPFRTEIEGQQFLVRKLREYILIPLKTGKLTIGGMTAVLQGNRNAYPPQGSPLGMKAVSPDLELEVVPAPERGRPDGYFPGDVGAYRLKASVNPRTVTEGDYVEVVVQIRGLGQIPSKVLLPESQSVTWEPPTMKGGPEIRDGKLQGTRVLKYAVQMNEAGELDLGQITLPHYNHRKRAYKMARADLGTVSVTPSKRQDQPATADPRTNDSDDNAYPGPDLDQGIPLEPRAQLTAASSSAFRAIKAPFWIWGLFFALPVLAFGGSALGATVGKKLESRGSTTKTRNQGSLREAKSKLSSDPSAAYRLIERAIYDSLDQATGTKTRGHLRDQLATELTKAGLDAKLSQQVQTFLTDLELMRYDESARHDSDPVAEAKSITTELSKAERRLAKKRGAHHS